MGKPFQRSMRTRPVKSAKNGNHSTQWESVDKIAKSLGVRGVGGSELPLDSFLSATLPPCASA